jgi:hypothetical protein
MTVTRAGGGIHIHDYQRDPLDRTLQMPTSTCSVRTTDDWRPAPASTKAPLTITMP